MKDNLNFDKSIKQKMEEMNVAPSDKVAQALFPPLSAKQKKTTWIGLLMLTLCAFILGGLLWLILTNELEENKPKVEVSPHVLRVRSPKDLTLKAFMEIRATARKENKMILVNVRMQNCLFCDQMKAITLENAEVKSYLQSDFIILEVDLQNQLYKDLFQYYNVTAAPTILFMNEDGKLLEKIIGFHTPASFIGFIDFVKEKNIASDFIDMETILEESPQLGQYFQQATEEHKPIFVHVFKEDCAECMESSQAIFDHQDFQEKWENEFVFLELSLHDRDVYDSFFQFHKIGDKPCSIILREDGSTIKNYWECPTPDKLMRDLETIIEINIQPIQKGKSPQIAVSKSANNGEVNLQLEGDRTPAKLSFLNMKGQEIQTEYLTDFQGKASLDFHFDDRKGDLIVQFMQEGRVATEKIVMN